MTPRLPPTEVLVALGLSILGVGVIAITVGTADSEAFVFVATAWVFVVCCGSLVGGWFARDGPYRVSVDRSRRAATVLPSEARFNHPVIGVGRPGAPFSYVRFWELESEVILALYLRPRWPYRPLIIEQYFESLDEALSTDLGRQVMLIRQDEYSAAVARRHFTLDPEPLDPEPTV
jgi:hypothetical protein